MPTCFIVLLLIMQFPYVRVYEAVPLILAHATLFHMSQDLITRGEKINWLNVFWTPCLSYHSFVCKDGKLSSSRMSPKEFPSVQFGYRNWWINLSPLKLVINEFQCRNIPMGKHFSFFQLNNIKCLLKPIMHVNTCHHFITSPYFPDYSDCGGNYTAI